MAKQGSAGATILVVEDDRKICVLLQEILNRGGYRTLYAANYTHALQHLEQSYVHLVLLDWMLGAKDGMDIFRATRSNNHLRDIPFILLTARSSVEDQVYGLDQGVVDYITKPFAGETLLARVRSCLLHHPRRFNHRLAAGECALDLSRNLFITPGGSVKVDPSDCRILTSLLQRPDTPLPRANLLRAITISNQYIETRTVDVHISRIRKRLTKIGEDWRLVTVRTQGYMLITTAKN